MKVTRVLHVSLDVPGVLEETKQFYADVLGLSEADRPDLGIPGAWEEIGDGAQLHLIDCEPPTSGHINPMAPHFCVGVEDLEDAVAELDARGIEHVRVGEGLAAQVWVRDPAGNVIELQHDASGL
jgi:glyoxylase I family protein